MTNPEPAFKIDDKVHLAECPSVGIVRQVESWFGNEGATFATWLYRMHWPDTPDDNRWYAEGELLRVDGDGDD